jgi:fermentation-respiration switch protein FrsA (DUF1100 family)
MMGENVDSLVLGSRRGAAGSRLRTIVRRTLIGLALLYLLACIGVVLGERSLTFRPDPQPVSPERAGLVGVTQSHLKTPDGDTLVVWSAAPKPGQPTILYFHGNGDTLAYRAGRIARYQQDGYGVFMIAYPGYSGSTGSPTERRIIRAAAFAYDTLRASGVEPKDIIIYGESLGTNVALQTAVAKPALALILEAPFTSIVDAWRQFAPILPIRLLLRDQFDSLSIIGKLRMPLLIMHGEQDRLVSFRLGRALFEAAPEPKRFVAFPYAGHTNLYDFGAERVVRQFIDDVRAGRLAVK